MIPRHHLILVIPTKRRNSSQSCYLPATTTSGRCTGGASSKPHRFEAARHESTFGHKFICGANDTRCPLLDSMLTSNDCRARSNLSAVRSLCSLCESKATKQQFLSHPEYRRIEQDVSGKAAKR